MDSEEIDKAIAMVAADGSATSSSSGRAGSGDDGSDSDDDSDDGYITNHQRRKEAKERFDYFLRNIPKKLLTNIG